MFRHVCKQKLHISRACISQKLHYFYLKTNMLADFQICINIPLRVQIFKQGDSSNKQQMNIYCFQQILWHVSWFLPSQKKLLICRVFILKLTEKHRFLWKTVLGILKIALHLRDRHIFTRSHWSVWDFSLLQL